MFLCREVGASAQVGLTHRSFQLLAVGYVIFGLVSGDGWAVSEVPIGHFNAWPEKGHYETIAMSTVRLF